MGVSGTANHSPMKEIPLAQVVRPMTPPKTTRKQESLKLPSVDDFLGCSSQADFSAIVGSGEELLKDIKETTPQSFVLHPFLIPAFFHQRKVEAGSVAEAILIQIENEPEEEARPVVVKYYELLLFLWLVDQGFATSATFSDPPNDKWHNSLVEETNKILNRF